MIFKTIKSKLLIDESKDYSVILVFSGSVICWNV